MEPTASILLKLTDLKGAAASIDTYDTVMDAVPKPLSTVYISATEGFNLGYGSNIEAQSAENKAKNFVIGRPTVKVSTSQIQEKSLAGSTTSTARRSSGTEPDPQPLSPPSTPVAKLFASPSAASADQHIMAFSTPPAPWADDMNALEAHANATIN